MKMIYENSSCRVFPGFYDSLLYNPDTLNDYSYGDLPDGYCWEFVKGGWQKFQKETCEDWVDAIKDNFKENPLHLKINNFYGINSPREYNFRTDRIQFGGEVNLNDLKKYCWVTRFEDFNRYLRETWSCRSDFISFVPNNVYDFEHKYKFGGERNKDLLIAIMIEWYLLEFVDFEKVEYDVLENDYERISPNVTLQKIEDWSLWDYEWDNESEKYVPTHKLEVA